MYVCRRIRLCAFLLNNGFTYVEERKDRFNDNYKVWLFNISPELMAAVERYYEIAKQSSADNDKQ